MFELLEMRQHYLSGRVYVPLYNFVFHHKDSDSNLIFVLRIKESATHCIYGEVEVWTETDVDEHSNKIISTLSDRELLGELHIATMSRYIKKRYLKHRSEALEYAIDNIICRSVSSFSSNLAKIYELKMLIREFKNDYNLTKAKLLLDELILAETEFRFYYKNATIIQKRYRFAILNPYCKLCYNRLKRELEDLNNMLAERW